VSECRLAIASTPTVVACHERIYRFLPLASPPPHTAAALRSVVLPMDDWPNRCSNAPSMPNLQSSGPASDAQIAPTRFGLPQAREAILACQSSSVPARL